MSSPSPALGMTATLVAAALIACLACAASTSVALSYLRRRQILDRPNERSSHDLPIPRGLGLGVVPILVTAWLAISAVWPGAPKELAAICLIALALGVLSWIDDLKTLPAGPRLLAQFSAVALGMLLLEAPPIVPAGWLPAIVERPLCALIWVGLINQVNFTDGIDGNLGVMLLSVGAGLFAVSFVATGLAPLSPLALTLAGVALGFLRLNWSPAKAFMGDVGSVPLGFLVGWLLLRAASYGAWEAAIILPLFYFLDTAVTYSTMIVRAQRFWRPHRNYLYQRATPPLTHAHVVTIIGLCNVVLLPIAIAAVNGRWWLIAAALVPVLTTYSYLSKNAKPMK